MNRRNFALSWGRKIFFGISWPLSSTLALLYFRSFIFPTTQTDWLFVITNYIGHFGLLNAILYFVFYCPLIFILPSYYVSRTWALLLIIALNLFIFVDALSFSNYQLHIYSYIYNLLSQEGFHLLLGSSAGVTFLGLGAFTLFVLLWIRGEMIWRHMQGRFSNPVKNWYLVLIFLCFGISKASYYYSDVRPGLAVMFPFSFTGPQGMRAELNDQKIYYPTEPLVCQGKQNPNVVFLVIKEWGSEELNADSMPKTFHMRSHAINYNSHRGVTHDKESGLFSLMYSVPASYKASLGKFRPVLLQEMQTRGYEIVDTLKNSVDPSPAKRDEEMMQNFRQWIENRSGEEITPYFLKLTFDQHSSLVDQYINEVILMLQSNDLLGETHVILTGAAGGTGQTIPLMWVNQYRRYDEVPYATTHYDVVPSLMQKLWGCKKVFKAASVGESLETKERDWYLVTLKSGFQIIDLKQNGSISVEDGVVTSTGNARRELIFAALKQQTRFYRPQ